MGGRDAAYVQQQQQASNLSDARSRALRAQMPEKKVSAAPDVGSPTAGLGRGQDFVPKGGETQKEEMADGLADGVFSSCVYVYYSVLYALTGRSLLRLGPEAIKKKPLRELYRTGH